MKLNSIEDTFDLSKKIGKLLSKEQAEYISVDVKGPFKPDIYRYQLVAG